LNWKHLLAIGAVVAAALVALGFFFPFGKRNNVLWLPGVVEIQEVRLGSKIGGRVREVLIVEGQVVKANQDLVIFDAPELEAQRDQWQARVKQARADLVKLENGPRQEEIDQAQKDWESAEADLKLAKQDFDRMQRLYQQGSAARADYDTALATRDRNQARAASAKAKLALLQEGTRPEEIVEAEGRLDEARGKLKEIEANLKEAVVKAPEPAIVEVLAVRKGDLVPPNQPAVRVLRAGDLWIKVYVPETELGKVRLDQEAEITIDAYPGRKFTGKVIQIASESEFTPRNIQSVDERRHQVFAVKVMVPQPLDPQDRVFKSGMAAEVSLKLNP
jgi:multidrug resistance efflux pump